MHFPSRLVKNIMLSLLLIGTLGLALLISRGGATHAASASIQLSQIVGPPTTVTTVSGAGFGSNETIIILCLARVVGTTTSSATGIFSTAIKIPATALPGFLLVKASGQSSGLTAHSQFHVRTDWSQFGFDAQHKGFNSYENVLSLSNVSALTSDWTYTPASQSYVVANGLVYVSSGNQLSALNEAKGTLKWSYTTGGSVSTATVLNGLVYIGSDRLYVLDATTGALKWSYTTEGGVSTPTEANNQVYISSGNQLYVFNATTGTLKWHKSLAETLTNSLAVTKQLVYVTSSASKLYVLDALVGTLKWSYSIPARLTASPVVANGLVYIGSYDPNGSSTSLYALNATTGALIWSSAIGGCGVENPPAVANGILYIGFDGGTFNNPYDNCFNDNLFAMNAMTGTLIWRAYYAGNRGDSGHNTSPVIANGVLYLTSNGYSLHDSIGWYWTLWAINLKTGAGLWSHMVSVIGADVFGYSPVVANGVVYVGDTFNNLYAFHLPGTTP